MPRTLSLHRDGEIFELFYSFRKPVNVTNGLYVGHGLSHNHEQYADIFSATLVKLLWKLPVQLAREFHLLWVDETIALGNRICQKRTMLQCFFLNKARNLNQEVSAKDWYLIGMEFAKMFIFVRL
jgi:hypothetical protein